MLEIQWKTQGRDIARVQEVLESQAQAPLFQQLATERAKNLAAKKPDVRKEDFWREMVLARLTTQNKVGPGSPVDKLGRESPFPLAYEIVRPKRGKEGFIRETVRAHGIGKYKQSARDLTYNLQYLEKEKGWQNVLPKCNQLTRLVSAKEERRVAQEIAQVFKGFGPKQSRNLLQLLGLTRYEIPLDSRVIKWLNQSLPHGHAKLHAGMLTNQEFYEFVLDGIQELCEKAETPPCLFDAAVFSAMGKLVYTSEIEEGVLPNLRNRPGSLLSC